jgi:hypothetical protein
LLSCASALKLKNEHNVTTNNNQTRGVFGFINIPPPIESDAFSD